MLATPEIFFTIVSFITIFIYHVVAESENWKERQNLDLPAISWEASQSVIWTLGILALRNGPELSYWSALPILPTALIYGAISETPTLKNTISGMTSNSTGIATLVLSGLSFLVYLGYIIYELFGKTMSNAMLYFLPLFVYICWLLIWINMPKKYTEYDFYNNGTRTITNSEGISSTIEDWRSKQRVVSKPSSYHFHHWMLALIGFFVSRHPTIVSDLGLGIFWGIFIQEMAAYGIDSPTY